MTDIQFFKTLGSVAALGFAVAIVAAILYFMRLPIFDTRQLAWIFFYGLIAFAIALVLLIIRSIWDAR